MSAATQFFGGGGDPAPANGTDIRIHLVGMGAGGGGGQGGGGGGAGRLLDMTNAIVSTGSTINITIGNGGTSPGADGVPGGNTTITYITPGPTRYGYFPNSSSGMVLEGGGGGSNSLSQNSNHGRGFDGGSGGGAMGCPPSYTGNLRNDGGLTTKATQESIGNQGGKYLYSTTSSGHPGGGMDFPSTKGGGGGGAGSASVFNSGVGGSGVFYDFTGSNIEYASGGDWVNNVAPGDEYGRGANSGPTQQAQANPGAVFIRYPTVYAEASAVSGHDTGISTSVTPGYHTYVWHDSNTPGSITF